ncbi:MAG: hypothetical protein Q8832_02460, partial [Candidatus Phytoplasma australasiaticum]|nr:hypothetical protein [Candidatus Phytoplasma australasiaticum]
DSFTFTVYLFMFQVLVTMGDPAAPTKALMDFSQPKLNDIQSSIVRPAIASFVSSLLTVYTKNYTSCH